MELTLPRLSLPRWDRPFLLLLLLLPLIAWSAAPPNLPASQPPLPTGRFPLSFVPNTGQANPAIHFHAQHAGAAIALTADSLLLTLPDGTPTQMQFLGANAAGWQGQDPLPGRANYLTGRDPARWQTNLPTYAAIHQPNLYPGIDLRYSGQPGHLLTTWTIAPTAQPATIQWHYDGAAVHLDSAGRLVVEGGLSTQSAPLAWQQIGRQQYPVSAHYQLTDATVALSFGRYDTTLPLYVESRAAWSGSDEASDRLWDATLDDNNQLYVTGSTTSLDFPTVNPFQEELAGYPFPDIFIAKLSADGSTLLYSTYLGGETVDRGHHIQLDSTGRIVVAGNTSSEDFPTVNPLQTTPLSSNDLFVVILEADGSTLTFSTFLGGTDNDYIEALALDAQNNIYLAGGTFSSDFPTTAGSWQTTHAGATDGFITKIAAGGTGLTYSTFLGAAADDPIRSLTLAPDGTAYLAGVTRSENFPLVNPLQATLAGATDAFITRLSADGSQLLYSTFLGGDDMEEATATALTPDGRLCVTGNTDSSDFPLVNPFSAVLSGSGDGFVLCLAAGDSALDYSTYIGGSDIDAPHSITVDQNNLIYLAGWTISADFPLANPVQPQLGGGYSRDGFVVKLAPDGSPPLFSTFLGGSHADYIEALTLNSTGRVHVAGYTHSTDFPTTANALQPDYAGGDTDGFITRFSPAGTSHEYSTYLGGGFIPTNVALTDFGPAESPLFRYLPYLLLALALLPLLYALLRLIRRHTQYATRNTQHTP
jgi:hypothetical protein